MSIANPEPSALGLPNLEPTGLITKILVSAAIGLILCVGGAAPASAAACARPATPAQVALDPFRGLGSGCREVPSAGLREELDRGIRDGFTGRHRPPLGQ
jgi:hypothetical protein